MELDVDDAIVTKSGGGLFGDELDFLQLRAHLSCSRPRRRSLDRLHGSWSGRDVSRSMMRRNKLASTQRDGSCHQFSFVRPRRRPSIRVPQVGTANAPKRSVVLPAGTYGARTRPAGRRIVSAHGGPTCVGDTSPKDAFPALSSWLQPVRVSRAPESANAKCEAEPLPRCRACLPAGRTTDRFGALAVPTSRTSMTASALALPRRYFRVVNDGNAGQNGRSA